MMDAGKMKLVRRQVESAEKIAGVGEYLLAVNLAISAAERALKHACRELRGEVQGKETLIHMGNALKAPQEITALLRKLSIDHALLQHAENIMNTIDANELYELYNQSLAEEKIEEVRKVVEWCEEKIREEREEKQVIEAKRAELSLDIITHDTLNPAGIVQIMSDMLLEEEKDEKVRELALKIRTNTEKLIEIIKNAKLFSELATKGELSLGEVELVSVLNTAIKNFAPLAEEKGITINFKSDLKRAEVQAHAVLEDAFSNLLSNAIKFSPSNEKVEVKLDDADDNWKISIADRGPGIPEEHKEGIFARFTRMKKASVKGSGLGLAIAKRIVELHKGRIWVEDNPGGGSVFIISLPKIMS